MEGNGVVVHEHSERVVLAAHGCVDAEGHVLHIAERGVGLVCHSSQVNAVEAIGGGL